MQEDAFPEINYLRLSLTDRCNLRCFYCTYWQEFQKLPPGEILTYEELLRLAGVAAQAGIRKVRLTGGEPLTRRGVVQFLARLCQIPGIREVCLTTNGVRLPEMASDLYQAGLRHLNISLDTLQRSRYRRITGQDNLLEVLAGLEEALDLGFHPIKINCVVLKSINDGELLDLALLARDRPLQVRFIELMPTAHRRQWQRHFMPIVEARRRLSGLGPATLVASSATAGPARLFRYPGFRGELGFISPLSQHHCLSCNRVRLTAAGKLRPCLLGNSEIDFKGPLRQGASDRLLAHLFQEALHLKAFETGRPLMKSPWTGAAMASIGG
ncbi:MAG: GTP 3',8-cyclase MoaA [Deltaproteobacteria bacterium]|nr:GTP 3',8-cyclase MoaA [Deltaproteobacteria bacterium]